MGISAMLMPLSKIWKISYRSVSKNAYTCLWQVLIMLQKTNEALYAAERARKSTSLARGLGNKIWLPIISTQVQ